MPPLQVTLAELKTILLPLTLGYPWGESTIKDLWTLGAPLPNTTAGPSERRIVFPGQLAKWLEDVLTKQGRPPDAAGRTYVKLQQLSR